MKIGITPINVGLADGEQLASVVRKADEIGLESAWTFEHVMLPLDYTSHYPYSPDGKMGGKPNKGFVDPLTTLAFVAGHTTKLRLGTGINILPQANPLLLAKQVASIDHLSGGRFMLGVGAGWLREEYEALGVPFERRHERFDDYLQAIKKVWTGETVEHKSDFIRWTNFKSYPLPTQKPHPPIIIGGDSKAALKRVAQYGDGWFVPGAGIDSAKKRIERAAPILAELGRPLDTLDVTAAWGFILEGIEAISIFRDLGVTRLVVPLITLGNRNFVLGLEKLGEALAKAGYV